MSVLSTGNLEISFFKNIFRNIFQAHYCSKKLRLEIICATQIQSLQDILSLEQWHYLFVALAQAIAFNFS